MASELLASELVPGLDRPLPRLIQGTRLLPFDDRQQCFELFDTAFESGCNAFETAIVYNRGEAERVLGDWLERRGVRRSILLLAKGCHPDHRGPRMTPADLREDLQGSLERLRTDYVDLYLLHRDDPARPVGEILAALNEELAAGRIRAFGASNWTHQRIQQAHDHAHQHGLRSFAVSSPGFSLLEPLDSWPGCIGLHYPRDRAAFEWYQRTRLPLLAWSPLASGFLSGHFTRENLATLSTPFERQTIRFYGSEANLQRLDRLRTRAQERGVSLAQAALAYVLCFPAATHAVLGARNRQEFLDCMAALKVELSAGDLAFLHDDVASTRNLSPE